MKANRLAENAKRKFSLITLPISMVPVVGGIGRHLMGEAYSAYVDKKIKSKYAWFNLLSDEML